MYVMWYHGNYSRHGIFDARILNEQLLSWIPFIRFAHSTNQREKKTQQFPTYLNYSKQQRKSDERNNKNFESRKCSLTGNALGLDVVYCLVLSCLVSQLRRFTLWWVRWNRDRNRCVSVPMETMSGWFISKYSNQNKSYGLPMESE